MLERLECAGLPCPCREVALNRFLRVDSKNNENSVIFVPQLEVYKFCELQNVKNSGNKHDGDILQEGQSDELALQEQLQVDSKFAAKEPLTSKLASEENDCEVKQCDRQQQVDEGRGEESEWHERESIEKGCDDNADRKMDSKIFKKWCIFSRLRKNCKGRKLTQLHSTDSKNNVVMERSSTKLRRPLNCSSNDLSIRRFNRTQRMEKRATKTLGIVVGMVLLCFTL
ncbi:unnamed protein product [Litomosoides sigmodontis]|uniref:Uncharacterized protein n=1 Tax=Litomosoides sigmodontis TaxID=42156 RepID=A0A3P6TBQ1_LITSI|nr:unnamed protein product [Litomosoides sigmodontis]